MRLLAQPDLVERVQAAGRDRQVDRPAAFGAGEPRVGAPLVHRRPSMPRRPSSVASRQPARPAPTMATVAACVGSTVDGSSTVGQRRGGPPAVVVGRVQRHRRQPDHVGRAGVGDHAVLVRAAAAATSSADSPPIRTDSWAPRRPGSRGVMTSQPAGPRRSLVQQRLQVAGEPHAASRAVPPCRPRRTSPATPAPAPSPGSAGWTAARSRRCRPGRRVGRIWNRVAGSVLHQPASFGSDAVGEVPLVHEHAGDRARPAVQVLVGAPRRPVDAPVVQRAAARCRRRARGPSRRPRPPPARRAVIAWMSSSSPL